jgi:Ser-tRNA(Ala) deacylase AlaX
MALKEMEQDWRPTKGYHFSNGPYVEYEVSTLPTDLESIRIQLEQICADIIGRGIQTGITFGGCDSKELGSESDENGKIGTGKSGPGGKPLRTVWYGDFGIQCGGTHVAKLGDIGICRIRKIKKEGNGLRVGYQVE